MIDASVKVQSRHTWLETAFFWQGTLPILMLEWAATPSQSFPCWYNSRLQKEPRVIHDRVHHSICLSFSSSLPHFFSFFLISHKFSLSIPLSLYVCISAAASCSFSLHRMFWLPRWLLLIFSYWFSFPSPASLYLFSEWLTFLCIFLCLSQSFPFAPLLFPSMVLFPILFFVAACFSVK